MSTRSEDQGAVNTEMLEYLHSQIETDEQVVWVGTTSVPGRMKKLWIIPPICLFNFLVCSFAFWNNPGRWSLVFISFLFWGGIPVMIFWLHYVHLCRTLYAITNRRALILSLGRPKKTESFLPEQIEFIRPVPKANGRGNLFFIKYQEIAAQSITGIGQSRTHGFFDIDKPEEVATLMRATLFQQQ